MNLDKIVIIVLIIVLMVGGPLALVGSVIWFITWLAKRRTPLAQDQPPVVIAHVPETAVALRYVAGYFLLDGAGQLSAAEVRRRDEAGNLDWLTPETRDWFLRSF